MDKVGIIEVRIIGKDGNNNLSPDNYDIKDIKNMLDVVEKLLYPDSKKTRPTISYNIEEGSVRNIFKTSMQSVVEFAAVASMITGTNSIDGLEFSTANAIENIQKQAISRNYQFEIKTSLSDDVVLQITPNTNYTRNLNLWVDAEFYLYGLLTNAGGKRESNIHLDTADKGSLTIGATKEYLEKIEENFLYKNYGVRVKGKQNIETGEMDRKNLELVEIIDYSPRYDEHYIDRLIQGASHKFRGINADELLLELRGGLI